MSSWKKEEIVAIILAAGRYAQLHQRALTTETVSFKEDQTLVTAIDTEIERSLQTQLLQRYPDSYVIGEESIKTRDEAYIRAALTGDCWIIDPIDGTVPYASGFDTWGISIGYMTNGCMTEGAIYLPADRLLLVSDSRGVYTAIGSSPDDLVMEPLRRRKAPRRWGIVSISQDIARAGSTSIAYSLQAIGSCVYSIVYYLCGRYRGVITKVKLWDIAAGIALLERAGHIMLLHDGSTLHSHTLRSAFLLDPQTDIDTRWQIKHHLFVGPEPADCQKLLAATTIA